MNGDGVHRDGTSKKNEIRTYVRNTGAFEFYKYDDLT